MAHIIRRNARKPFAAGRVTSVGYMNVSFPYMEERKCISLTIGDAVVRIELTKAVEMANDILKYNTEYGSKD